MDLLKINLPAFEQLTLEFIYKIFSNGIVSSTNARWMKFYPEQDARIFLTKAFEFMRNSGWLDYIEAGHISTDQKLIVMSSLGYDLFLPYPMFYQGRPYTCLVNPEYEEMGTLYKVDSSRVSHPYIIPSITIIAESRSHYLIPYGNYTTFLDFCHIDKPNLTDDQLSSILERLHGCVAILNSFNLPLDISKSIIVDSDYKVWLILNCSVSETNFNIENQNSDTLIEDIAYLRNRLPGRDKIFDRDYQQDDITIDQIPDFTLDDITDISIEELTNIVSPHLSNPLILDMIMCLLSIGKKDELLMGMSINTDFSFIPTGHIENIYCEYFTYARVHTNTMITKLEVKDLYQYQKQRETYELDIGITGVYGPSVVRKELRLLTRNYDITKSVKIFSEKAERVNKPEIKIINVKLNDVEFKVKDLLIFFGTPLMNALELAKEGENIEYRYLSSDMNLLKLFLQGKIMPMIFYGELSKEGFINLSGKGTFLGMYEIIEFRQRVDLAFKLGVSPGEYLEDVVFLG